jgi:hypothetical protein
MKTLGKSFTDGSHRGTCEGTTVLANMVLQKVTTLTHGHLRGPITGQ